jgi:hypothetical protein
VGSINDAGDITATVAGTGMVAYGPDGLAHSLAPLVSPAYGGSVLTSSGSMNASGQILGRMIIGQSGQRLVRLVAGEPCTTNCIRVATIQMKGKGPGYCDQGSAQAMARLTVTDEAGIKLSGVRITAHFFDDYWLDQTVVGRTSARGQVTFKHVGPPCVGAIAILVTDATSLPARTFDRTTGILTDYVIPQPSSSSPWRTGSGTSPTLVTEGEGDFAGGQSQRLYELLTCPKQYRPFTAAEGTSGHMEGLGQQVWDGYVFDWLDATLVAERSRPGR